MATQNECYSNCILNSGNPYMPLVLDSPPLNHSYSLHNVIHTIGILLGGTSTREIPDPVQLDRISPIFSNHCYQLLMNIQKKDYD